ncbi:MFS transporter [Lyngbya sp. CCY1209]|uniref:MFS transporter n=1 Tax=Lyngbya sp. CCY1209 TaxID=2886103 RepID=UPI002D211F8A|nr:MFS transporter [Lyngbya sp. CCY1209]MEB3882911.1 MFS transporter [Lyngbya sp. CCY1209]
MTPTPPLDDRRQIFGWIVYDWANSAYVTTVVVAVLPAYFASVVVPPGGLTLAGVTYSATALWGFVTSLSAFLVFLIAPIIGAISDFSASKKKFLLAFAYTGCCAASLLFFCRTGDVGLTLILYIVAQIGFIGGNIFYDAFLPNIASEDNIDWVSGKGFAFGYVGGGLQFALSLALVAGHGAIGISAELAARLAILMAAAWWGGFSLITAFNLREAKAAETLPPEYQNLPRWRAYLQVGVVRTVVTVRKVKLFKHLLRFLIAYMIYNNGIQTVIAMATIYGAEELGFSPNVLMITLLVIQFVSVGGALGFSKLAERISAKNALMVSLVGWSFVVIYAYFLTTPTEYFLLGGIVGLVQGGSQSLSRSFYGSMVPPRAAAEFYGFYSVFNKGSAIFGPLLFALIRQVTGTARNSILSLIAFFIVGLILLYFVDATEARRAKDIGEF